ncbi:MAG: heme exporter protein CcmD [Motiliproteus sp.]|nr:heme exporter protein CcmD [Motiliproteus sp.]MCW9051733.1 heme exporter protein CcmD [Motiliproteus sp.]
MHFESFSDLIEMGGHGPYVWTCYAIAATILIYNIVSPLLSKKQFFDEQTRRLKREQRISNSKS